MGYAENDFTQEYYQAIELLQNYFPHWPDNVTMSNFLYHMNSRFDAIRDGFVIWSENLHGKEGVLYEDLLKTDSESRLKIKEAAEYIEKVYKISQKTMSHPGNFFKFLELLYGGSKVIKQVYHLSY